MRNPIIAALDVSTAEQALKLAEEIAPAVGAFKIGSELFTGAGPDIVKKIRATGARVFLDLKFHDIPNTVAKAVPPPCDWMCKCSPSMPAADRKCSRPPNRPREETAWKFGRTPPLVLGVTVLTSLDTAALREIGLDVNVEYQVRRLAIGGHESRFARARLFAAGDRRRFAKILPAQCNSSRPASAPARKRPTTKNARLRRAKQLRPARTGW